MKHWLAIAALLAVAAVSGFVSYEAFTRRPANDDRWDRAMAIALRAEHTKAQLRAMGVRDQAVLLFLDIAGSGPPDIRSRAAMVAGLLQLRNAADADSGQGRGIMISAAASLRHAVRLDRSNDDAAYDLELLLARAKASGRPLPAGRSKPRRTHSGKPGTRAAGTGY
jgi:hypothetical protein